MTFDAVHFKVTMSGTLGNPVSEIWQTSFRLWQSGGPGVISEASRQTFLTALGTASNTFLNTSALGAGLYSTITLLKIAQIGRDHHYWPDTEVASVKPVSYSGVGAYIHPLTTALVVSLRTARPRGRAAFGKMYWPAVAISVGQDGVITTGNQATILTAAQTWINAVNSAANTMGTGLKVAVMSELGEGTSQPVTRVGIGREPDYISRRKSKTLEVTTFAAVS